MENWDGTRCIKNCILSYWKQFAIQREIGDNAQRIKHEDRNDDCDSMVL